MSPDRATFRWLAALTVSVALHAAAVSTLGQGRPAVPPPGTLTVALRRVEPPGDGKPAGGATAAQPVAALEAAPVAKPPVEQMPPVAPKPPVVPKKPAPLPLPAPKPKPAKVQPAQVKPAPARTEAASAPKTPDVPSAPAEGRAGGSTPVPAGGGSVGTGGGNGGGSGSGTGRGGVVDVADLKVLRRVKPDYPAIARRRREEGTVTLLLTLEGDGVAAVRVEKTSGFSALDEAAVAAVRRWRFENAGRTLARVPVTFKLGK